jgi:cell wall-associated NlpC family hydrolase
MRRLSFITVLTATLAGCASTGAVPRPFPLPGGPPTPNAPGASAPAPADPGVPVDPTAPVVPPAPGADGYSISSTALSLRGAPYRNGGADPQGFDCSGFVQYVFGQHGVKLPRDVRNQFDKGKDVDPATLEPGDLVFFTTVAPGASHVGILVGGSQFVHAPSTTGVVRVESLSSPYWSSRFVGAKRLE